MKNSNKKPYYSLFQSEDTAVLNIFGDITSYAWEEYGEMSNVILSKKLEEMKNVSIIDVYINSYGGEVAEGLAIYNALKRHKAKVRTHVDGFACSIASVIFMAGDERIMPNTSCLMIHNPWTWAKGNAKDLKKQAEDLEKIGECSINAYMEHINITKEELVALLDNESWISPSEAVEMGFATEKEDDSDSENANQSIKEKVIAMLLSEKNDSNSDSEEEDNSTEEPNTTDVDTDDDENEDTASSEDGNEEETDTKDNDEEDDSEETDENENEEENEDDKNAKEATEKATNIVGAFLMNIEKEILK